MSLSSTYCPSRFIGRRPSPMIEHKSGTRRPSSINNISYTSGPLNVPAALPVGSKLLTAPRRRGRLARRDGRSQKSLTRKIYRNRDLHHEQKPHYPLGIEYTLPNFLRLNIEPRRSHLLRHAMPSLAVDGKKPWTRRDSHTL